MATRKPVLRKWVIRQLSYLVGKIILQISTNKFGFLITKATIPQHKITITIPINVKKLCSVEVSSTAFALILIWFDLNIKYYWIILGLISVN